MQALWMVLGSLFFATMAVCVKYASAWFTSSELVFYRGLLGMFFLWLIARQQGVSLATRYPGMHAWRSLVGVISLGAWFYSLAMLPLATSMTLNYMSSVWVAAFLVGGSLLTWVPRRTGGSDEALDGPTFINQAPLVLTVLAGFVGVVLMLRPTIDQNQAFAGLVGLLSGLTAAFAYMQVMALGKLGEPDSRTVFYFAVGSAVAGAVGMVFTGVSTWNWMHALWLLPVGLLASLGQLCMTRAYSQGATLVVASLQYFGIVFGAIYSVSLFGDRIPLSGWTGMVLIVASGIAATVFRERAAPNSPAEEH
jgi:S-adenosylmethionine uptake transporter